MSIEWSIREALVNRFSKIGMYFYTEEILAWDSEKNTYFQSERIQNDSFVFRDEKEGEIIVLSNLYRDPDGMKKIVDDILVNIGYKKKSHSKESSELLENRGEQVSGNRISLKELGDYSKKLYQITEKVFLKSFIDQEYELSFGSCEVGEIRYQSLVINNGEVEPITRNYYYAYLNIMMHQGKKIRSDWFVYNTKIQTLNLLKIAQECVKEMKMKLESKNIKSGSYNLILRNEVAVNIFAGFVQVFFADNVQKGHSALINSIGKRIASSVVTLIDEGETSYSSHLIRYDHEGMQVKSKKIIESGILCNYLYNLRSASIDNVKSTGNGFVEGNDTNMGTSVTNFYLQPSQNTFKELLNISDSIMITSVADLEGAIDIYSGDFSLAASGFQISGGKVDKFVPDIVYNGNFYDMIKKIKAIDGELYFALPTFTSTIGMPNIMVENMYLTGKAHL